MNITLPKDVLETLPSPDDSGIIRVTAGLRMGDDGSAQLVELNDVPLPDDSGEEGDDLEAAANSMPSPDDVASQLLG